MGATRVVDGVQIGAILVYILISKAPTGQPATVACPDLSPATMEKCRWKFHGYMYEGAFGGHMWEW